MKNKLKILFAYFRGLRSQDNKVYVFMRDSIMEDSITEAEITVNNKVKFIQLPKSISEILTTIIDDNLNELEFFVDLTHNPTWGIIVKIDTKHNEIILDVEYTKLIQTDFEIDKSVFDLPQTSIEFLEDISDDVSIIDFDIEGSYGDGNVDNLEFDNKSIDIVYGDNYETNFWSIGDYLLTSHLRDNRWYSDGGLEAGIRIWGNDIFVKGKINDFITHTANLDHVIALDDF